MSAPAIEVVGHMGAAGYAPGNSRRSFELALAIGVDRIECDIVATADGDLVLRHDAEIELADGERVPVAALPTAELRAVEPDVLRLEELLDLAGADARLMIDIKAAGCEAALAAVIRRRQLVGRVSVPCGVPVVLRRLAALVPDLALGLSLDHLAGEGAAAIRFVLRALGSARASELMLHHRLATPVLVASVQASGRRVNLWTVDRPHEVRRAIGLRPDGIISNRPDLVRAVLAGRRLPRTNGGTPDR